MKYLHIFSYDENEKFSTSFIEFINENFNLNEHYFLLTSGRKYNNHTKSGNNLEILPYDIKSIGILTKYINKSEKVFFHGLSNNKYIDITLLLQPRVLKKCNWCIWGGDLYLYESRNSSFRTKLREIPRRTIIKNIGGLITHVKGDFELAQKWYGAKGEYYYSFMYTSNLFKGYNLTNSKKDEEIYIQIGNSGLDTNNHLEVFTKLEKYKTKKIQIICPLSYAYESNPSYREEVIKAGKEIFGDKFIPILEFMPFDEYLNLLSKVDIAIFNHDRQQAVGNITTLLGLGKKIYIRDNITTWDFCIEHGLKVFDSNGDFEDLFEMLDNHTRERNIENIKDKFSKEKLKKDLNKLFS
ncbi:TDP-N-acetylfucosamine:lipid II N-acetylfucosaminyltransferase [Paenibacillus sp. FSL R10-2796]|uniref:TDP-N-acetylfucosamine:lipid II N-acetylfucosaminyltransferase n=1 Tax=Paenibacillus sp. FSL R10-2796 TaxID=2954663 RepID=UPI0030D6CDE7